MPKVNHRDLVDEAWNESRLPFPPRSVESILPFTNLVLSKIHAKGDTSVGYVKSPPGGGNSVTLPDGQRVRVGRVMYPDGWMYKFMNDVPNGGPQWVTEEKGENPQLFHPYLKEPKKDDDEIDKSNLEKRMVVLESRMSELELNWKLEIDNLKISIENNRQRMEAINHRFEIESKEMNVHKSDTFVGTSRLFGGTVESILKSRE